MLYFMDLPKKEVIKEFVPRVPDIMMIGENAYEKRICLSNSISGCLTSAPWGNSRIDDFSEKALFRVYEFSEEDIKEGNLITPEELYQTDKVRDADVTKEHWVINQTLKPRRVFYIHIEDYTLKAEDIIPYKYLQEENLEDYIEGSIVSIEVEYKEIPNKDVLIGKKFELNVEELLKEYSPSEIEDEAYLLIKDYIRFYSGVSVSKVVDNKLILEVDLEDGLHQKEFLKELEELLGAEDLDLEEYLAD